MEQQIFRTGGVQLDFPIEAEKVLDFLTEAEKVLDFRLDVSYSWRITWVMDGDGRTLWG